MHFSMLYRALFHAVIKFYLDRVNGVSVLKILIDTSGLEGWLPSICHLRRLKPGFHKIVIRRRSLR